MISKILLFVSLLGPIQAMGGTPVWYACKPESIFAAYLRVHVKCSNPINGIQIFAASTDASDQSTRFLTLMSQARGSGKDVHVFYDPDDTSGTSFGCKAEDCRKIQALWF